MQNKKVTHKRKVVAIVGPTASGKTGIGVKLAKEFDGEIISADSRQVYRGLDLGTGKDLSELSGVQYHMIDIVDPGEKMTLFDYLPLARAAIEDILSRGKLPIIVGGSGLFVQGLVEGFELVPAVISTPCEARVEKSPNQRSLDKLEMTKKYTREQLNSATIEQLNKKLLELDPVIYENIDHSNQHRLIRAIERSQEGLKPIKVKPNFEVLQIGLDIPREELHARIDRRVDERFEEGMLEEVEGLLEKGVSPDWLLGLGLEYREITQFVLGDAYNVLRGGDKDPNTSYGIRNTTEFQAMSQILKFKIHQFARRQLTWFRRFPEIKWLSDYTEIKKLVQKLII
ncbi:MAG: tRNA (adenosine(37)-N6)-dimethylallyltransferase MiaA [Patescibacteria group bacterium]